MRLTLNLKKSLEKTAAAYFNSAKKLRKKAQGAKETAAKYQKKLEVLERKQEKEIKKIEAQAAARIKNKRTTPLEWFEKFRWFISSEGFLCIGGRDATSNEMIIKKQTEKDDIIFHTEMSGSPFFVIKTKGRIPGKLTLQETANATAIFSRAWKLGLTGSQAFWVTPEQVTKTAQAGEYMSKGSFMVRGKRHLIKADMDAAIGKMEDGKLMCGPESAIRKNCKTIAVLRQGRDKPSDCAKKIAKKINADIDDVLKNLPAGTSKV